ncbi:carboxypeptidase-like regulatory domain-containing protein [Patescibacteria group bacterium]|nr:carboxypeptidase-like regulatory domain-containing protein [Patescibacteria group bacterium]MBU4512747.1 carboxypeptidase-like regulatory domain-containing protein [Patescibacteria group bacterium]MCG2693087.1 carboxypeptidase-like regulatory domain-containing protein [Candidatus Parcubacteria bacterium]
MINNGTGITLSPLVTLNFYAGADVAKMAISNFSDLNQMPGSTGQIAFSSSYFWNLCEGRAECLEGAYTVYVKFYTQYGQPSQLVSDSIAYQKIAPPSTPPKEGAQPEAPPEQSQVEPEPEVVKEKVVKKPVIQRVGEAVSKIIPDFLKPEPKQEEPEEKPFEQTLPKQAPQAMRGDWSLLPESGIKQFVLEPLPEEVRTLAQKFPNLSQTFAKLGITKFTDLEKLKTAKLTLPCLTKLLDLPQLDLGRAGFTLPKGVPLAKLSASLKEEIPTEIVFAKTGNETIDLDIDLTINEQGQTSQKITTISGQPLKLIIKPEAPVKEIKGYLVLTAVDMSLIPAFPELSLADVLSQSIFAKPVLAQAPPPTQYIALEGSELARPLVLGVSAESQLETRLALQEFEYTDKDGDGIYTAEIAAPVVAGEYEIITLLDYQDINLGTKEIRLITVIDPEGYVYEKLGDKETRIPGAIISLFWLNPQSKKYEEWPASEFQQENPQITNNTGKYSFLVPEGSYYLNIEAPGYEDYEGKPLQVKQGAGIHTNIELKTKHAWLKAIDWKVILLVVVVLLLLYNFYRDKLRERIKK